MLCGSAPEINCIEPDFTAAGAKEWDRRLTPRERAEALFVPAKNVVREPSPGIQNAADPKWPVASYWPVYLSNFMVNEWDEQFWYDQVSDFFAHHGLQTRMIYFHTLDAEFLQIQKHCSLIDALVYFRSEQEAKRAIATCHRSLYYGHKLNVMSGRTPEYFCNERSVRLVRNDLEAMQKPETSIENVLTPFGRVEFATRQSEDSIVMEFTNTDCMVQALSSQNSWKPIQLRGQVQKQRFVEADVKSGISWLIESQEGYLQQRPRPEVSQYFEDGIQPIVETRWKPPQTPKHSRERKDRDEHLKQLWKQKKKEVRFQKLSKWQKNKLYQNLCKEVGYGMKPGKKVRKVQQNVLKSVNFFLRTRDKPTLTQEAMVERVRVRNALLNVLHVANVVKRAQ
uniref:RRM domain-containing protein n=1 Tax=Culex tarsalis TaxID=7177 RepID=A0A1Q3G248_CULTA